MGIEYSALKIKSYSPTTPAKNLTKNMSKGSILDNIPPTKASAGFMRTQLSSAKDQNSHKAYKTLYIEVEDGVKVPLKIDLAEQNHLTCGWLVSEAVKVLAQNNLFKLDPNHPIMALQTVDKLLTLDYWLSIPERPISVLKEGLVLKPFYGDNSYKIEGQKLSLSYFDCIKLLGSGGFSKVYLGNIYRVTSHDCIVKRKDTGKFYALKVISKEEIVGERQRRSVLNEREIFTRIHHPFLSRLHFAFQTVRSTQEIFLS